MSLRHSLLALMLALAGCPAPAPPPPKELPPVAELALGPGDTFDVRVFGEPDLSATYRVAEDGSIDYPLIGQLRVDGLQPHAAADLIAKRLGEKYLRHPQVSILVREQPSKRISVIGQVTRPGNYSYVASMNVVDAITNAGGFLPFADRNGTSIMRIEEGGQKVKLPARVKDIVEGKERNILLRPGDIISVPEGLL